MSLIGKKRERLSVCLFFPVRRIKKSGYAGYSKQKPKKWCQDAKNLVSRFLRSGIQRDTNRDTKNAIIGVTKPFLSCIPFFDSGKQDTRIGIQKSGYSGIRGIQ